MRLSGMRRLRQIAFVSFSFHDGPTTTGDPHERSCRTRPPVGTCRHAACKNGKRESNRRFGKRRADRAPPLIVDVRRQWWSCASLPSCRLR